jgi:hypothetical protein
MDTPKIFNNRDKNINKNYKNNNDHYSCDYNNNNNNNYNNNYRSKSNNNSSKFEILLNDEIVERFLRVQSQLEEYDNNGVFERLNAAEEEFEIIEKNKQQAEINFKLLTEQSNKEKQDYENISSPSIQSYFKNKKDHDKAISKEQVFFIHKYKYI